MLEGLILKGLGGFYYVKSGEHIYECKPRGIFRLDEITPVAGDRVSISVMDEDTKEGIIEKIHDRKNFLVRPPVANIDQVVAVFALKSPSPDFLLLDKLLVKAASLDIKPIICVNKIDLGTNEELVSAFQSYASASYTLVYISASQGNGMERLEELFNHKMSILAGPSGVGKSTIVNWLRPELGIETGHISERIKRGRHTTRQVEFYQVGDSGYLADTPGFTSFKIDDIQYDNLQCFYPEFRKYIDLCRFAGCSHVSEPQCAVKNAVDEGKIDSGRHSRYTQLFQHLKQIKRY